MSRTRTTGRYRRSVRRNAEPEPELLQERRIRRTQTAKTKKPPSARGGLQIPFEGVRSSGVHPVRANGPPDNQTAASGRCGRTVAQPGSAPMAVGGRRFEACRFAISTTNPERERSDAGR